MIDPAALAPETTPANVPVPLSAAEIEALVQQKSDQRVAGLMSVFDKKFDALAKKLDTVARASLSETEVEDMGQSELRAEADRLKRENAMLKAGQKYDPRVTQAFASLLEAEDPEDQLAQLAKWINPPAAPAVPIVPAPSAPVPPVDPNNPPRPIDAGPELQMDETTANRILAPFLNMRWPGSA